MSGGRRAVRDITVGIVVALAAVIFAITIFSIGSEQRLWARKVHYKIRLADTGGLQVGSPVRLVGVQVGTVTDISLSEDPNRSDIDIEFTVDKKFESRIRKDTTASLKVLSLLGGDKFLQLTAGSAAADPLKPGSYVNVPEEMGFEELQALGGAIADDLASITTSLKFVLGELQNPQTFLGQALSDPNFGKETLGNLRASSNSMREILDQVEHGQGLVGRLLTDEKFASTTMDRLESSLTHMETLLARATDEKSGVSQAIAADGSLATSLDNMKKSSAALVELVEGIKDGHGLAGRMLSDDELADRILGDLAKITAGMKEITDKINSGKGTLGSFVNDPQMYQDLQNVVRGVQKSRFLGRMIRHYREKGEKALEEEKKEDGKPPSSDGAPPEGGGSSGAAGSAGRSSEGGR